MLISYFLLLPSSKIFLSNSKLCVPAQFSTESNLFQAVIKRIPTRRYQFLSKKRLQVQPLWSRRSRIELLYKSTCVEVSQKKEGESDTVCQFMHSYHTQKDKQKYTTLMKEEERCILRLDSQSQDKMKFLKV